MTGPILVTGGGGFIGSRIVEILQLGGVPVRAGVRRWASAARIGRLDVEIVPCDVTDKASIERAMAGCSGVIHCAVGDARVTIEGTEQVLAAAAAAKVGRVVHISTIDVYGDATGRITEETPLQRTGRPYGDSKIEAEAKCLAWADRIPVSILRPSIVYGPFSEGWTVSYAQRLQQGAWPLPAESSQGTCNLIYVDDLVRACVVALRVPHASGTAFNVNGNDRPTWHQYFSALNDALGLPPLRAAAQSKAKLSAAFMAPVRSAAKYLIKNHKSAVMAVYQRSDLAKKFMKSAEQAVRHAPSTGEFRLYSKALSIENDRLRTQLGWAPEFDMARGVELSVAWLRHHAYAPARSTGG